jgi:hypothetical protein
MKIAKIAFHKPGGVKMIRSFLSLGGFKHIPRHSEPLAAQLKVFTVRFVSIENSEQAGRRRFSFSDEEIKRNAAVGPVQAHLSWEEAAVKSARAQNERVTAKRIDLEKTQSYIKAIETLERCPYFDAEDVRVLHDLRIKFMEFDTQSELKVNN